LILEYLPGIVSHKKFPAGAERYNDIATTLCNISLLFLTSNI